MGFTLFSSVTFLLLPGSEHGVGREFFFREDAAFVTPVCPRLVCIRQSCSCPPRQILHAVSQGSDVLIRFFRVPTKMGRNSVCPQLVSNFCGLDKSTIPPVYLQPSTMLYRPSSFIHLLPVVTFSDNDSKQIAAATSFGRMSALLTLRTFLVKVKKI